MKAEKDERSQCIQQLQQFLMKNKAPKQMRAKNGNYDKVKTVKASKVDKETHKQKMQIWVLKKERIVSSRLPDQSHPKIE